MKIAPIKILAIDPGINHTGWSIGSFDPSSNMLSIPMYGEIQAHNLAKKELRKEFREYGSLVSLSLYAREFDALFDHYTPIYVASEDAFYNPRTPNAFLSLKLCIHTIQRLLYLRGMRLYLIPPTVAKQAVWGKGTANKLAIQESIQNLPDLTIRATKQHPIEEMQEHEADSIAIMYAFTKNILPDLLIQEEKHKK